MNFAGTLSNLLNARQKSQPVMKKNLYYHRHHKSILDIHDKKDANLKNLRIAALGSLAFAGCFRYDELCNIVLSILNFTAII